jgi:hypothetical protein
VALAPPERDDAVPEPGAVTVGVVVAVLELERVPGGVVLERVLAGVERVAAGDRAAAGGVLAGLAIRAGAGAW